MALGSLKVKQQHTHPHSSKLAPKAIKLEGKNMRVVTEDNSYHYHENLYHCWDSKVPGSRILHAKFEFEIGKNAFMGEIGNRKVVPLTQMADHYLRLESGNLLK